MLFDNLFGITVNTHVQISLFFSECRYFPTRYYANAVLSLLLLFLIVTYILKYAICKNMLHTSY